MRYLLILVLVFCSIGAFTQKRSFYHYARPLPHGGVNDYKEPSAALKIGLLGFLLLFIVGIRIAWLYTRREGGWYSGGGYQRNGYFSKTSSLANSSKSGANGQGGASGNWQ